MKIIFMGTPEFSVNALNEIINAGHEVVGVYSQPPRPSGRGQAVQESPVHKTALAHNIPVFTPTSLKTPEAQNQFAELGADLAVVVAYGLLLPKAILDICPCINIHASLLPRWRGAAPIQRAIMDGDAKTGITIMRMDEGLDTGDMLLKKETNITPQTSAGKLHDELSDMGAKMIVEALALMQQGKITRTPQSGEANYAAKIKKEEARIDWNLTGEQIIRNINGFNPYPGAYFEYEGEKIKILEAKFEPAKSAISAQEIAKVANEQFAITCSNGTIYPLIVQRQGKKIMPISEMLRGFKPNL